MIDTAQTITFEESNSNYEETGVGFDETENPTMTLAAKPTPLQIRTYKSPETFYRNGYLLPLLGYLGKLLPNNYHISVSAKTRKDLPSVSE